MNTNRQQQAHQRLFDAALHQIRKQGGPSVAPDGSCQYRGAGDCMCAFGPAIAEYDPNMEGLDVSDLLTEYADQLHPWALEVSPTFALSVQGAHDRPVGTLPEADLEVFMSEFEENMQAVATAWNLTYTEA